MPLNSLNAFWVICQILHVHFHPNSYLMTMEDRRIPRPPNISSSSLEPVDITLCGKRDCVDVTKSGIVKGERILGYPRGPDAITRIHKRGTPEESLEEKKVKWGWKQKEFWKCRPEDGRFCWCSLWRWQRGSWPRRVRNEALEAKKTTFSPPQIL